MNPTLIAERKTQLVEVIRFLHAQGWAPATSSNYSFRLPGETNFFISESGIDKGNFTEHHFLYVSPEGELLDGSDRRPSAETLLHSSVYGLFPDAHCVLHTHSVMNTIVSRRFQAQQYLYWKDYEILKGFQGVRTHEELVKIPIFANTQDIPQLAGAFEAYASDNPQLWAFLIAGHGMYTWGNTIPDAKRHCEVVEFLLTCSYYE